MTNGIRQESIICPILIKLYVGELNWRLSNLKTRCPRTGEATTNLVNTVDPALLAATGRVLNKLRNICETFVTDTYINYNAAKSVCKLLTPKYKQKF